MAPSWSGYLLVVLVTAAAAGEWDVMDWWQQTVHDDLFGGDRIDRAAIGPFIGPSRWLVTNDLQTMAAASHVQLERVPLHEPNATGNKARLLQEVKRQLVPPEPDAIEEAPGSRDQPGAFVPTASIASIKSLFYEYFTDIRNNLFDAHSFLHLKRKLRQKFIGYGLQTAVQGFYHHQRRHDKGHNLVAIHPGLYRNTSKRHLDSILVIGAHYDTVSRSPGVEDNGSGSVAVLELARLLHRHRCKLNTTVMLVLFDMEEDGLIGSKHFVRNYLFPAEIEKNRVPVKGAIIMDMLLEYDPSANSQMTRDIGSILPEWMDKVRQNRFRADFAAVWARRTIDASLFGAMQANWLNPDKYKLFLMDPPLPKLGRQLTNGLASKKLRPYSTFLRSDHSSFWYPYSNKNETINAILLTDLGPWRRKVANKYHSSADNSKLLSKQNLFFLKNAIDSIMATVVNLSDGLCQPDD